MIKVKLVFFLFSREFWQTVITIFHYLVQQFRLALSESNKALTVCLSRPHGETFFTTASTRSILPWSQGYMLLLQLYDPIIHWLVFARYILSSILGHLIPNRRAGYQAIHPVSVDICPTITKVQGVRAEYLLQLIKDQRQVNIRHLGTRRELEPKCVPQLFLG